jgi:chitinase
MLSRGFIAAGVSVLLLAGCGERAAVQVVPAPVVSTAPVVRDGSLMAPGRPQLAHLPMSVPVAALQPVTWNMWWGENGSQWKLYVNGKLAESGRLSRQSPKAQQATAELMLAEKGPTEIKVVLCNDYGCTESEPVVVTVAKG